MYQEWAGIWSNALRYQKLPGIQFQASNRWKSRTDLELATAASEAGPRLSSVITVGRAAL